MDLPLTPEQETFRSELRAWLAEKAPRDPEPADAHEAFQRRRRWQGALARAGYVGIDWPAQHGGRGLGPVERLILEQETARAGAPTIAGLIGVLNIGPAISAFGTAEQKARFLEPLRTGDEIWCQGMSEPGAGSDLASLRARAVLDGDEFVINGQKVWCSNADEADWCQLYVRTGPEGSKHAGITCLLVDMRAPGIEVRPIKTIVGSREFCEVFFDDARVPSSAVLGEVNGGWSVAIHTLMHERLGALVLEIIIGELMERLLALAREAPLGSSAPRAADPLTRDALGNALVQTHVLHALGLRILQGWEHGEPGPEGSILKVYASELMQRIAELGLSLGEADAALAGVSSRVAAGWWQDRYLQSRSITIAAGTSEVLRNVIGERMLGLPKG